ncbi:MAG: hypothetical protein O9274_12835 [Limnobacter sp.]|uniref:hypothetical protein n=1 Tax=Limnobacter sp. TaxID=2003368 RepID=UPI0022C4614B|nr:hypothetical protein [Limnobacter sp.]MCZ8016581.1 hypothetical protein [Limnobacter sp.]
MIVYTIRKSKFLDDVLDDQIHDAIHNKFQRKLFHKAGQSEGMVVVAEFLTVI